MADTIELLPSGNGGANDDVIVYLGELVVVTSGAIAKNLDVDTGFNNMGNGAVVSVGGSVKNAYVDGPMTVLGSVSGLELDLDYDGEVTVGSGGSVEGASFTLNPVNESIIGTAGAYLGNVTVSSREKYLVAYAGASVVGSVVQNAGSQFIYAGAFENAGTVNNLGDDVVAGNAFNETVNAGGFFAISGSGYSFDAVLKGSTEFVYGKTSGDLVESGSIQDVLSGGHTSADTIYAGGTENISVGGAIATPTLNGGTLNLAGKLTDTVLFKGTGGTLNLIGQTGTIAIANFTAGNTIVVEGVAESSTVELSDTSTSFNIGSITLQFPGGEGMGFTLTNMGDATAITLLNSGINCFAASTNIDTIEGKKSIESLKIGDKVMTASGEAKPVKWISIVTYHENILAFTKTRQPVLNLSITGAHKPIRIKKNALDRGVPCKDLLVSRGHCIQIEDVLVPAALLVNGQSIVVEKNVKSVTYYHIELADHDVVIANGAPSETFRNVMTKSADGQEYAARSQFHNAHSYDLLYPSDLGAAKPCMEIVQDGFRLQDIQRTINARAGITSREEQSGNLTGYIETIAEYGTTISGWAYRRNQPDMAVRLDVIVDGNIYHVLANAERNDVTKAGHARTHCGFTLTLPTGIRSGANVEVKSNLDQSPLALTRDAAHAREVTQLPAAPVIKTPSPYRSA